MAQSIDERVQKVVDILQEKKALDILLMDVRSLTDTSDFFILCSGTSDQHVKSLTDDVREGLKKVGEPPWHIEGNDTRRWVLIDCVDIVIHIFRQEAREFYALERLWGDAEITSFEDAWETPVPVGEEDDGDFVFSRS